MATKITWRRLLDDLSDDERAELAADALDRLPHQTAVDAVTKWAADNGLLSDLEHAVDAALEEDAPA